ncbi:MAG: protein O-mannosyl-transferase family [Desulfobacteria bacterium]|nr:DUF2723 domain-containing protein [Deltaproteobacteria bacterium]
MLSNTSRNPRAWGPLLPFGVFLVFSAIAIYHSAPHLTGGDCGEYVTAGAYLGNTHPPGNPVHHMASYLFQQIPFGDAYGRSVLLSALSAAGAVAVLFLVSSAMGVPVPISIGISFLFGFSKPVMHNALVTEVYTLLTLFLALYSLYFLSPLPDGDADGRRRNLALAFLSGVGMGVHYLSIFYTLPLLFAGLWRQRRETSLLARGALLFLVGFLVMLYLPARALAHPPANYGDPSTPVSFLRSVGWSVYSSRPVKGRNALLLLRQFGWTGIALLSTLSAAILPLTALGLVAGGARARQATPLLSSAGMFFVANVLLQNYPSRIMTESDAWRFLAPAAIPLHLYAGIGMTVLFEKFASSEKTPGMSHRRTAVAVLCLFGILVAVTGWRSTKDNSRNRDFVVRDYFREIFLSLPLNASVILDKDTEVFSGLATHFVERLRTDLYLVDRTQSHLANIYGDGDLSQRRLEFFKAQKEKIFLDQYPDAVAFVTLPEWAIREKRWRRYGFAFLTKQAAKPLYDFPKANPVRFGKNAATAYDLKTRGILKDILLANLARSPLTVAEFLTASLRIERIAWDDPSFYIEYGIRMTGQEMLSEAESAFRRALTIYPPSPEGKLQLAILMARTRRLSEAALLLADPEVQEYPEAQFYLGNYYNHIGLFKEAVARYEEAARLGYRTATLWNNMAVALIRTDQREKARQYFLEALRVDPSYQGARDNLHRLESEKNSIP